MTARLRRWENAEAHPSRIFTLIVEDSMLAIPRRGIALLWNLLLALWIAAPAGAEPPDVDLL